MRSCRYVLCRRSSPSVFPRRSSCRRGTCACGSPVPKTQPGSSRGASTPRRTSKSAAPPSRARSAARLPSADARSRDAPGRVPTPGASCALRLMPLKCPPSCRMDTTCFHCSSSSSHSSRVCRARRPRRGRRGRSSRRRRRRTDPATRLGRPRRPRPLRAVALRRKPAALLERVAVQQAADVQQLLQPLRRLELRLFPRAPGRAPAQQIEQGRVPHLHLHLLLWRAVAVPDHRQHRAQLLRGPLLAVPGFSLRAVRPLRVSFRGRARL